MYSFVAVAQASRMSLSGPASHSLRIVGAPKRSVFACATTIEPSPGQALSQAEVKVNLGSPSEENAKKDIPVEKT